MHHIYHTRGLILGSSEIGESGKRYAIFTRELGLVYARATGVRKMHSKLRFILQDFSYVKVDLVQGKNFWRVTSASKTNTLEGLTKDASALKIIGNISALLKRLLPGSEANTEMFDDLLGGLALLEKHKSKEELQNIEAVIVLRLLAHLGYIGGEKGMEPLIKSPFDAGLALLAARSRRALLNEINKAIRASHL